MIRKIFHYSFVVLTLLSVAVLSQSCLTTILVSSLVNDHKVKARKDKVVNEAKNKSPLDAVEYSIENVTENVKMDEMIKYLQSNNYVVVDHKEGNGGKIESIKFVARNDFYKYYYKSRSGNNFSKAKKGKGCRFIKRNIDMYGYIYEYVPAVIEVYWSGDIIDGYICGKGSGLYTTDSSFNEGFCYFEGEYVYGIPISEVDFYRLEIMNDNRYIEKKPFPLTIKKKTTDYYLVEHRDKFDQVMLDNFASGKGNLECERYKNSVNDVRSVIANYKSYAEDIILNDKTPSLSQEIGGIKSSSSSINATR